MCVGGGFDKTSLVPSIDDNKMCVKNTLVGAFLKKQMTLGRKLFL